MSWWREILRDLGALAIIGDPGAYVVWCPVHESYADLRGTDTLYCTHWMCIPGRCEGIADFVAVREWAARHSLTRTG